jgi:hypothetical protein
MVPELRSGSILLNAHANEDVASQVAGEDEETARRFGWWPKRSTEQTVRAAYADWARDWRDDGAWWGALSARSRDDRLP